MSFLHEFQVSKHCWDRLVQACNDLLRKRNQLIAVLEGEIRDSDDQYKTLIEEFHENTSVLAARMENQVGSIFKSIFRSHFDKNYKN